MNSKHIYRSSYQDKLFYFLKKVQGTQVNKLTIAMPLIHIFDLHTAAFLSQMIYWRDKGHNPGNYIYKSCKEWKQETGLSAYHVGRISNELKKMGILETKLKKANAAPTIHYRLNHDVLKDKIIEYYRIEGFKTSALPEKVMIARVDKDTVTGM